MSTVDQTDEIEDSSAPLIEHLAELRQRLIYSVSAFLIGMVLCFTVSGDILKFVLTPIENTMRSLGDPNPGLQTTAPQELFFVWVRVSVVAGLLVSFPVIAYQMWRFVAPGLYRTEKNAFLPFLVASPVLFIIGAAFAHFVVIPLAMAFFLGFADMQTVVAEVATGTELSEAVRPADDGLGIRFDGKVDETLSITLKMIVAFGLCFQLPVLLTLMGKAGLASSRGLRNTRKYAMLGILVVAALVTPPDVITQIILFTVVYGLYEISIHLVAAVERGKDRAARAEGIIGPNESLFDLPDDDEEEPEAAK